MASRAPIAIQNENLPIFRGIDGKKAGAAAAAAARVGRQERRALGDLSKARRARPASSTGGKATAAASVGGSGKNLVKPSYLSDEDWMKCCEWAKDGVETASFTGNDMQKLLSDKLEERIQKKVEKAMGTMQLSMDSLYRIDAHSKACMVDPEDKTELDLDTEFLPPMSYLSSRLGEHNANHVLSDLEFEHETFANCNLDLKLKEEYGT
ncbi:uncharacterized protein LOC127760409 [Oryza glaberrima]|uniref:Uncharacterized protein n=1 Tax=Oryza glaberrima TaxID=4538 RepID=I1NUA9_ORYGL|nr:uncharacterized protein LOC127760409 [Oryza glaberrima]XP_052140729.1 uncharacterized protein LOC127760409 [Oryza glaberrima]XP_052140798.1 uncharacterized protein LOC127760409 [Oryza glaberrima]